MQPKLRWIVRAFDNTTEPQASTPVLQYWDEDSKCWLNVPTVIIKPY